MERRMMAEGRRKSPKISAKVIGISWDTRRIEPAERE
jgi:hypothetical protein